MNTPRNQPTPDTALPAAIAETMMHRTAIGVFLVTVSYTLSAAAYLVDGPVAALLDRLEIVLGIAAIVAVLPIFVKYSRLKARRHDACPEADSYMAEMFKRAGTKAFSLTFVFLVVLDVVTKRDLVDYPTAFFINVILAFSLGVFSITFFRFIHSGDDDERDEDYGS